MKPFFKLLYLAILISFLPAYTQMRDSSKPVRLVLHPDSVKTKEIAKIKRNVLIDLLLIRLRNKRRFCADSIKNKKDTSVYIIDTAQLKH